ncbi:relaxase/mobilization nuclease domain-containing protein [Ralstonia pseudosolanacearum]|uniref:relaxase/mobilization nuclease domain-containing protein n=1 Tax=Ralstonia pseudosolanacearum TaxID=1310165 RepID=UPI003D05F93F
MKAKVGRGNGFRGLLAYVFGAGEKGKHDRASVVGSNMVGTDPRGLAAEFAICRKLRPEVKNPVWHCSLALPKEEQLDSTAWHRVCERHLQLMGIDSENHMWVAVNRPGFSRHPRAVGNGVVRTLPAIVRWRSNVAVLGCRTSRCS